MSEAEEGNNPPTAEADDIPISAGEISNAPPPEQPDKEKTSWLKWLEERPLIRALALLTLVVSAFFGIFTFFTGADTFEGVKNLFSSNRCAVGAATEDEVLVIVTDFIRVAL
jgi:hypothetical protein